MGTWAPANVDTTTPANVETTTPANVETTTPANVETTTPGKVDTTTPGKVDTTTPATGGAKSYTISALAILLSRLPCLNTLTLLTLSCYNIHSYVINKLGLVV